MKEIINSITNYFTGDEPANPDVTHNISLLKEIKLKIETGIFHDFLKNQ